MELDLKSAAQYLTNDLMQRRILALLQKELDLPHGKYELENVEFVSRDKDTTLYPKGSFQINLTYKGNTKSAELPICIVLSVNGKFDEEVDGIDMDFFYGPDFTTEEHVFYMASGDLSSHGEAA